ncbi:MAG: YqgE/AlgH family protein [Myxococcota bacterium]
MSESPTFLVAAPTLDCGYFAGTLVLLVDHDAEGSFGFVVNRASALELPSILQELGLPGSEASESVAVLRGGPVSPETGWVLFERTGAPFVPEDVLAVGPNVGVTASVDMLQAISRGDAPARSMLALGYAGWGPGQLEDELREGSWIPVDMDLETLFEVPFDDRWSHALACLGIDPRRVVASGGAKA